MDKKVNTPTILINQLILVGHRKNYIIPFNPGVNIIYGDADTGKSSILDIINYLFGSKELDLYDEIETSVSHCILDVELNNINYTIKRDVHNKNLPLEVTQSTYAEIDTVFPKKYGLVQNSSSTKTSGLFSDFLLSALNLPNIRVKNAPSKVDSNLSRLSFRDIFKYCYLNQDDVGSKKILDIGSFTETKTKQTFKYIHGLLDTRIADLEEEITILSKDIQDKQNKFRSISDFLSDTKLESIDKINTNYDQLEGSISILEEELREVNSRMTSDSESYTALKEILHTVALNVDITIEKIRKAESKIEQYSRLRNDYINDIEKIKSISQAKELIGKNSAPSTSCPICESELNLDALIEKFEISESDKINHELNALNRRTRDLAQLVDDEKSVHRKEIGDLQDYEYELLQARRLLDDESKEMITPYLSQRDGLLSEISSLKEKKKQYAYFLKVRSEQIKLKEEIDRLSKRLTKTQGKLQQYRANAPTLDSVTTKLGFNLHSFLESVHIKNCKGISISPKTFLPIVRDRDYSKITSGGLRTITSIGYFLSLFKLGLEEDINLPRFLMIDTVGKYLGKTSTKEKYLDETDTGEDYKEDISDPTKYKNIYEFILNITEKADENNQCAQIILVDNDVPPIFQEKYAGFIIKHFSSSGENELPVGLIDDIDQIS